MASDPTYGWYIIACKRGAEGRVARAIPEISSSLDLSVPAFKPGFLPMRSVMNDQVRARVLGTPDVVSIVRLSIGSPLTYEQALAYVTKPPAPPRPRLAYAQGDYVRIINGPYLNMEAQVTSIDWDRTRVIVTVKIFDRPTPLELGFNDVEKMS